MRPCKLSLSWLTLALVLQVHAIAQPTEVTAQAKVKFTGAASNTEHHSNEGVVLWLTPVDAALPARSPGASRNHLQLAQKNKQFVPHLLVVQTGSVVDFPNLDPFFHNVFSLSSMASDSILAFMKAAPAEACTSTVQEFLTSSATSIPR